MRLSEYEQKTIKQTAGQIFGDEAKVYLFGSRVDDNLRGGDIDIYIEINSNVEKVLEKKIRFLVELEKAIGEQKIDVVINNGSGSNKLIYQVARSSGIQL
jgi:predicted nucleotidyltransferase